MTDEELKAIEARAGAAMDILVTALIEERRRDAPPDWPRVADYLRKDIPALVAEVRRLRKGMEEIRAIAMERRYDMEILTSNPPMNALAYGLRVMIDKLLVNEQEDTVERVIE